MATIETSQTAAPVSGTTGAVRGERNAEGPGRNFHADLSEQAHLSAFLSRRVEDITEALWGTRVSPRTVSELNQKIYAQIEIWRQRPIEPFSGSERSGMSDVLLRPEEFRYGRLRPPSRLSMNSLRSALTAVLAGQNPLATRAKEDYERAFTQRTEHYNQADASAKCEKLWTLPMSILCVCCSESFFNRFARIPSIVRA